MKKLASPLDLDKALNGIIAFNKAGATRDDVAAKLRNLATKVAGKKLSPQVIAKLKKLTAANYHNEAYIEGAKLLGLKKLSAKFELIGKLQQMEGSLPSGLNDYRYSLYKVMKDQASRDLSKKDFEDFIGSF